MTLAFFEEDGKIPEFNELLKIIERGLIIDELHFFSILTDIWSKPCDLLISRERIRFNSKLASIVNEDREECDKGPNILSGSLLELLIKEHCLEKWLLK